MPPDTLQIPQRNTTTATRTRFAGNRLVADQPRGHIVNLRKKADNITRKRLPANPRRIVYIMQNLRQTFRMPDSPSQKRLLGPAKYAPWRHPNPASFAKATNRFCLSRYRLCFSAGVMGGPFTFRPHVGQGSPGTKVDGL